MYWVERARCLAELAALGERLTPSNLVTVQSLTRGQGGNLSRSTNIPPTARTAIQAILEPPDHSDREWQVYVPTGRAPDEYVFLWRNRFEYADVRVLPRGFGKQSDAAQLRELEAQPSCSSLWSGLRFHGLLCGRATQLAGSDVTYAVKSR
jgi:hypothetical protein